MAKFDKDGDGKLDYEEFKKMIQMKKKQKVGDCTPFLNILNYDKL